MPVVTIPISNGLDDLGWAFTLCDGYVRRETTSPFLRYWSMTGAAFGEFTGWAGRFQNVTVPQGATINEARLEIAFRFEDVQDLDAGNNYRVYADDTDDSDPLQAPNTHPALRTFTTAFQTGPGEPFGTYGVETWLERRAWNPADGYITAIIQEIINRPGWSSGNALSLILTGEFQGSCFGTGTDGFQFADWDNLEGQSGAAGGTVAQLVIDYADPVAPTIRAAPIII